jgi:hypothetical protein
MSTPGKAFHPHSHWISLLKTEQFDSSFPPHITTERTPTITRFIGRCILFLLHSCYLDSLVCILDCTLQLYNCFDFGSHHRYRHICA